MMRILQVQSSSSRSGLTYTYTDGSVQDCSISSVLAIDILQSCTKPQISSTKSSVVATYKYRVFQLLEI